MSKIYIRTGFWLSVMLLVLSQTIAWAATPVIRYKIERDATGTYRVYMSSTTSFTGNSARTGTGQVTIKVPTGGLPNLPQAVSAPQAVTGNNGMGWSANTRVNTPSENPAFDYISFGFSQSATPSLFDIPANQDILLFSFSDMGACPGTIALWSTSDPFQGVSSSTNPGNQLSIFGNGSGNSYLGNYGSDAVCSPPPAPDLISSVGPVPPLTVGQTSSLPVSVSNIGNATANGPITFVTTLPTGITAPPTFASINGWGCTTTGQLVNCSTPNSLGAGNNTNFIIPITPIGSAVGTTPSFGGTPSTPTTESTTVNNAAPPVSPNQPVQGAGVCAGTDCGNGVRYGLRLSPDGITYTVYMKSANTYLTTGNQSRIATAQVTVYLPTGTQISSTTSLQPGSLWTQTTPVVGPLEISSRDYRSFGYSQTAPSALFNIPANVEIPLFSFQRTGICSGELGLIDLSDPFQGLSTNTNPGNQMTILGNGVSNAWKCNYTCPVACAVPVLTLVKQAPTGLTQNTPFSYSFTVTNTGNGPTTAPIVVTDILPAGLVYVSGSGNNWTCANTGQTVSCTSTAAIAASGSSLFTLTVNPTLAGSLSNNATVTGGGTGTTTVGSQPCPTCPVGPTESTVSAQASDLLVGIQLPPVIAAGQSNTLTVTLTNLLAGPAPGPQSITITLPAGVSSPATFSLNGGWGCSTTGQSVVCTNPASVSQGQIFSLAIPFTPASTVIGSSLLFTATAALASNETNGANNTASATSSAVTGSDLAVSFGTLPALSPGQAGIIPITVSNVGQVSVPGALTLTVSLPVGVSLNAGALPAGWSLLNSAAGPGGSTLVTLQNSNAGGLAPGGSLNLNLPVLVQTGISGTAPFSATITPAPSESNLSNNVSSAVTTIGAPDLTISVTGPNPAFVVAQTSNVLITVSNNGTAPATGPISTTISFPAGYTVNTTNLPPGWLVGSTATNPDGSTTLVLINNTPTVTAGQSLTLNLPVTPGAINANVSGTIGGVVAPAPGEVNTGNNTGSLTATPTAPDLIISAAQPSPNLTVGQASAIAVTIQNIGNATAGAGTSFQIAFPAGLALNALPAGWILQSQVPNGSGGFTYTIANNGLSIAAGTSASVNLSVTPGASLANATLTLGLYVNGAVGEVNLTNNSNTLVITTPVQAAPAPDLAVSVPAQSFTLAVNQGSLVSFNVANIGSAGTTDVLSLQFTMPSGFTTTQSSFVTGGWSCATTGNIVNCTNAGGLAVGASSALTIPVLPTASAGGLVNATFGINVAQTAGETILPNNIGQINYVGTVLGPDLAVSFPTQSFTLTAGQTSSVSVVVSNVSTAANAAGPLSLTFAMPATFVTATSSFFTNGWGCTLTGSNVSCTSVAGLSAGASVTLEIPVVPQVANVINPIFVATVAPAIGETMLANNVAQLLYTGTVLPGSVQLAVKMLLQGSYDINTGLMYDKLRAQNKIPLVQPYFTIPLTPSLLFTNGSQTTTTTSAVLSVTGVNAIVDWVMVELRSAGNPASIVAATPALVQRDGDVVSAADGVSSLVFQNLGAGSYYVSVRHRNHLGAMSATALPLSATLTTMDFTQAMNVYVKPGAGSYPQHLEGNKAMLWAGNTNGDAQVIFQGTNNDVDPIFFRVITDPVNTGQIANFIAQGYDVTDVNMDGTTIFQGPLNEVDLIFFNVVNHPANPNFLGNFIIQQHLP